VTVVEGSAVVVVVASVVAAIVVVDSVTVVEGSAVVVVVASVMAVVVDSVTVVKESVVVTPGNGGKVAKVQAVVLPVIRNQIKLLSAIHLTKDEIKNIDLVFDKCRNLHRNANLASKLSDQR
jgi:hypothetical protein